MPTLGLTINETASNQNPVIASGFGTNPTLTLANGTRAFKIVIGSGGTSSTGVITLPQAANGWVCYAVNLSIPGSGTAPTYTTKQSAFSTTSVTLSSYDTASPAASVAWNPGDILLCMCSPF